jgi:hypothetical protein
LRRKMISSIAWVPAGVAAAVPRKYEMSAAERELVRLMEKQGGLRLSPDDADDSDDDDEKGNREVSKRKSPKGAKGTAASASGANNQLPADLRMDEYSSDDEDDDDGRGYAAGQLLVGNHDPEEEDNDDQGEGEDEGMTVGRIGDDADSASNDSQGNEEAGRRHRRNDDEGDSGSSSSDEDDDLEDVPDTREYVPVDVEGLAAMGLSQIGGVGGGMDFDEDGADDDDASDLEDVRIAEDDAIVLVAKTEDVRAS